MSSLQSLKSYLENGDRWRSWTILETKTFSDHQRLQIELISQEWRPSWSRQPIVWKHQLLLVIPHELRDYTNVLLFVNFGKDTHSVKMTPDDLLLQNSRQNGQASAELRQVPNHPVHADNIGILEDDALMAYSWRSFFDSKDTTDILQFPMVKAMQAALSSIEEIVQRKLSFIVAAASKQAWAAWLFAAFDPRVVGIVPIVAEIFNLRKGFEHHLRTHGRWTEPFNDFVRYEIIDYLDTSEFDSLAKLIDPIHYLPELNGCYKYILFASGDEFFPPDTNQTYFRDFDNRTWLRCMPNQGHLISNSEFRKLTIDFCTFVFNGLRLPNVKFYIDGCDLVALSPDVMSSALAWSSANKFSRDFRLGSPAENFTVVGDQRFGNEFRIRMNTPNSGHIAYFLETRFVINGNDFSTSSPVFIL